MESFSRDKRLITKQAYERVFKQSKKFVMPDFFVLAVKNDLNSARLGFALSKKCLHKASLRNRIKRLVRESFRRQWESLSSVDIVVLAKPSLAKLNNEQIRSDLNNVWQKINKMAESS